MMLRLHALEERIVLDAALMVDLAGNDPDEDEHEAGEEGGAAPAAGVEPDAGLGDADAARATAALSLIDPSSTPWSSSQWFAEPLLYREGDGVRPVLLSSALPVLGEEQGFASWAVIALEGPSDGDELVAPNVGGAGGFAVTRDGPYRISLSATESLLLDNTPAEVEELLRNTVALVGYANSVQDPLEGVRTLHVSLGNDAYASAVSRLVLVSSVNDAPVLEARGPATLAFAEPADPALRTPLTLFGADSVAIGDVDSALVGRASVWITDAPAATADASGTFDRLQVQLPADGSITARTVFTPVSDGTMGELRLTLEGAASAQAYARLLETVRFDSLDTDPQQLSRTVRISVADMDDDGSREDAISASIERRIGITPTNTAPEIGIADARFSEATDRLARVPLLPQLQLLDPDSANRLARVVVVLDNPARLASDSINAYLDGDALFSVTRVTDGTRDTYTVQPRAPVTTATVGEFQAFLSAWSYSNTIALLVIVL